ncbi:MAG: ATP synthase F1 subunit epsilon [Oscillospiraceae bacterium]|nr:ATP synthase F1 subunit epsilon [Oscillospiraceae bacterium]
MTSFPLKIVTPDGLIFDGQAEEIVVRTTSGDMGVLAGHINCVAPLGMGQAMILSEGKKRYAACIGGMLSVVNGEVTLVPTTFEWADAIDLNRAERAYERAQNAISSKDSTDMDIRMAEARLKRALIRKSVASNYRR